MLLYNQRKKQRHVMSEIMKNIEKSKVLLLKDEVAYQPGQIVSKTLVQNDASCLPDIPMRFTLRNSIKCS